MRNEFKVTLKKTKPLYAKRDMRKLKREPVVRQYLVLAHQIQKALYDNPDRSMRQIASWIGLTPARLSQIMHLLYLSPFLQEEILLSEESSLHKLSVNDAHDISREIMWEKQKYLWLKTRDKER